MIRWLKRHTSMRCRLAVLLVLLLAVPVIATGWFGYLSIAGSQAGPAPGAVNAELETAAAIRLDEAVRGFRACLEQGHADLALRTARCPSNDPGRLAGAFADLPDDLRPAVIAVFSGDGRSVPSLTRSWSDVLLPLARAGGARSGLLALPSGGTNGGAPRPASLYEAVIEPRAGGACLVVLRDLSGAAGEARLASLPFGASTLRSITLRDERVLASHGGGPPDEVRRAAEGAEPGALLHGDLWHRVLGQEAVYQEPRGSERIGAVALHDLDGAPAGLAIIQAADRDFFPLAARPTAVISQVARLVGWISLVGVLLALGIGWTAPRWVWRDIKSSTDTIFGSVDRLRELVRRNSRAIDEQSRLIQSVTNAVSSLETASQSIAETSRSLAHNAEQSAWVSQSGNQRAEVSQRAVLDVRDRVEDISIQMEELERRCAAIGSLLGFIDHLSTKTNTLSINATIQAAGSGSSGREFSVVAGEIRKLADLALDSTQDIKRLIEEIQDSSRTTLGATKDGQREVDKCLASFDELESAFARILRWVETTTQSAHGIETSTARQSEALQSVAQSVESLEERARETEGNFHDVVAAADELAELGEKMNDTWRVG